MAINYTPAPKMSVNRNMSLPGVPDPVALTRPKTTLTPQIRPAPTQPAVKGFPDMGGVKYEANPSFTFDQIDPALAGVDLTAGFVKPPVISTSPDSAGVSTGAGTGGATTTDMSFAPPTYTAPDLSTINNKIERLSSGVNQDDLRRAIDSAWDAIDANYNYQGIQEQQRSREALGQQMGDLANAMVNPLSSGAQNVENRNEALLNLFLANLNRARTAEKLDAESRVKGEFRTSAADALKAAQSEREALIEQSQREFENRRAALSDAISSANAAINVAKEKRAATNQERDDARSSIEFLVNSYGSQAFKSVSPDDIRNLEKTAGVPYGYISQSITLKEAQNKLKERGELKEVGGNLYQLVFNPATGAYESKLVQGKPAPAGGAGGVSSAGFAATLAELNAVRGDDGFTNTDTYKALRSASKDKTTFDKNFSYLLNPNDKSAQAFLSGRQLAYNAATIPNEIAGEVIGAVRSGSSLDELIDIYRDVDPTYLQKVYTAFNS